ncbi:MAG: winged helix-turn-helix transcriptional regulator [Acidimicrobiales bacterium]
MAHSVGTGEDASVPSGQQDAHDASGLQDAVARVGDRWTLLVVHALLDGPRRFNELIDALPGLAPNVLSKRLRHLEHVDVVVATPYTQRPPRFDYRLTATGAELAGALRLLASWGSDGDRDAAPLHHGACGTPVEARWYCPTCERFVDADETDETRFA